MTRNFLGRTALVMSVAFASHLYGGAGTLIGDTYVNSASPGSNFGSATLINVNSTSSGLFQFNLAPSISRMLTNVVNNSTTPVIGRATLTVYVNKVTVAGTLQVAPLLGSWGENTVTFATLPALGSVSGSASVSAPGFITLDVTNEVQGWLNSDNNPASPNYVGGANFGLIVSTPDSGGFVLDSKESTSTSHQAELDIELATDFEGVLRKDLTLNSPGFTSLMSIHLTGTNTAGGRIYYMVRATDGGSQIATEEGMIQFQATANSITCNVQATDKLHLGTVNSGCTPGFFNPASQPGVSVFDNVTFSSPAPIVVHEVYFRIQNLSGSVIRLEP